MDKKIKSKNSSNAYKQISLINKYLLYFWPSIIYSIVMGSAKIDHLYDHSSFPTLILVQILNIFIVSYMKLKSEASMGKFKGLIIHLIIWVPLILVIFAVTVTIFFGLGFLLSNLINLKEIIEKII